MKNLLIATLCFWGVVGCMAPRADTALSNTASEPSTISAKGVQQIYIEGGSYFFKPNYLVVKVNVPVELMIKVEDGLIPHNFVINAPEMSVSVEESLSTDIKTIRFTPKALGKITFYCSHGLPFTKSHREKGMEGIIEIVK